MSEEVSIHTKYVHQSSEEKWKQSKLLDLANWW